MLAAKVPLRAMPERVARPDEHDANHGTFERRIFQPLAETDPGYWWRVRLTDQAIATTVQARKGYNRIPCKPMSPNTLFITREINRYVNLDQGRRILLNEYLGRSLKEYIQPPQYED